MQLRKTIAFALLLTLALLSPLPAAADPISWNAAVQGAFVTSLCPDRSNHLWIGTEDHGLWRYGPDDRPGKQFRQFTAKSGLGDDTVYALCCDRNGWVWAGTLRHGVSVYNGSRWQNYAPPFGPLGFRVFALAVSPLDGDVWIATEGGLTRYSQTHHTWTHYTGANGLPPGGLAALAFASDGTLYVGTACAGLEVGKAADDYKQFRVIPGPAQRPNTPTGSGLPSGDMTCLLASPSGAVYAGTTGGLARSLDGGQTWRYTRGADWRGKVLGQWHGPEPREEGMFPAALLEDYVTCLAEDSAGRLAVGHRQKGVEVWDTRTQTRLVPDADEVSPSSPEVDDVSALLSWPNSAFATGGYGSGLTLTEPPIPDPPASTHVEFAEMNGGNTLPLADAVPTLAQLNALLKEALAVAPDPLELSPHAVALADDWRTEGDWLGRYGRYWACLCACCSPYDYVWGAGWRPIEYHLGLGDNHAPGDALRYWVQWEYSDNPRVLELPPTYLDSRIERGLTDRKHGRREAEADDHGEDYPQEFDGPHVQATLQVPKGLFYLSVYEFNKDGHTDTNRFRDYRLSLRTSVGAGPPEEATGRVRDFWGGVWKRFLVRGPAVLSLEVNRNNSLNTVLPAVMLDLVDEQPAPYFQTVTQWQAAQKADSQRRQAQQAIMPFVPANSPEAAEALSEALERARRIHSSWWAVEGRRPYSALWRWYAAQAAGKKPLLESRLGTCAYQLREYALWEDC